MSLCESCHAGCCRSFAVPITGADILRMERETGLSFWDFACRWADPEGAIAGRSAPHFHFADEPATPFVICLLHEESRFLSGTTCCRFLVESPPDDEHPRGLARCGIYGSRPMACRNFPTKLNETAELAVIYDIPESGRAEKHPAYDLCPREWQPADVDPIQAVQDLVVAQYEMAFFQQLAHLWNRSPRPWNVFPDFLRLAYAGRVLRESATRAADAGPATLRFPSAAAERAEARKAA